MIRCLTGTDIKKGRILGRNERDNNVLFLSTKGLAEVGTEKA